MSGPPDFRREHSELRGGAEFSEFAAEDARSTQASTVPYAHLSVVDAGDTPAVPTRIERARQAQASADSRERSS